MNCELIEKEPITPYPKPRDIVLNGKVYGEITPSGASPWGCSWHAHFSAKPGDLHSVLIQGHGDTPEEAFRKAFDTTERDLERQLLEVREARREMLGTVE